MKNFIEIRSELFRLQLEVENKIDRISRKVSNYYGRFSVIPSHSEVQNEKHINSSLLSVIEFLNNKIIQTYPKVF